MIVEALVKLVISSVYRDQYLATQGCCALSRATAASNWGWVSSYGSVIPRDGFAVLRYSAASAM